ncbi:inositol-trisphosphate 3-kinase homolog isoform X2 [Osmia bicornis bicornis]|uniref:inositol-trisphosphate 3-kinase homolog isoform X2 n=1 Tax=Osmia bicornis bicornis TaxID=1437191 RepID=UPI0010F4B9CE|nr:inositol-trisphosphate 3-kinase homolog isoform X2 [Osmia bicornis bicornis]
MKNTPRNNYNYIKILLMRKSPQSILNHSRRQFSVPSNILLQVFKGAGATLTRERVNKTRKAIWMIIWVQSKYALIILSTHVSNLNRIDNALDLTAPASDVLLKNRLKSWFQLSGHPDGFAPAGPGTVWKRKTGGAENTERIVYEALSKDKDLRDCIPRYYREVDYKGETFIELQDLLFGFNDPHVMDIKMGTRTFLESEVSKTIARPDLYQKMIAVDPNAPTKQEHEQRAVTKLRYMQFREQQSSTCSHGFRIEAMKLPGAPPITDLKKVKSHQEVLDTMKLFLGTRETTRVKLLARLKSLRSKIEASEYFKTHEIIGSSIFMIYDNDKVGVWLIDFAKTQSLPNGQRVTHREPWEQGNHEEGFLFGLDNLISTIEEVNLSKA